MIFGIQWSMILCALEYYLQIVLDVNNSMTKRSIKSSLEMRP